MPVTTLALSPSQDADPVKKPTNFVTQNPVPTRASLAELVAAETSSPNPVSTLHSIQGAEPTRSERVAVASLPHVPQQPAAPDTVPNW